MTVGVPLWAGSGARNLTYFGPSSQPVSKERSRPRVPLPDPQQNSRDPSVSSKVRPPPCPRLNTTVPTLPTLPPSDPYPLDPDSPPIPPRTYSPPRYPPPYGPASGTEPPLPPGAGEHQIPSFPTRGRSTGWSKSGRSDPRGRPQEDTCGVGSLRSFRPTDPVRRSSRFLLVLLW